MTATVVITGASAGIGRAAARMFGERGDRVGLIARGEAGLEGAARDVREAGGSAMAVPADVADFAQVDAAAQQIEETLGPIDVWVNVAFSSVFAPFAEITPEEFRRVAEVSYLGFVHGTMAALARMRPRDRGVIVQVGSALGTKHPAAVGVLRRQARHQRVHLLAALRAAARQVRCQHHRGPDARGEHAAVLLGALQAGPPPAAGPADLPAGSSRPRRSSTRLITPVAGRLGGRPTAATILANRVAPPC